MGLGGVPPTDRAYRLAVLLPTAGAFGGARALRVRPVRIWARSRSRRSSWKRAWIAAKSSAARG